jgi:hypothetical protein
VRQRQSVAARQGCKHEHLGPGHAKRADKGGRHQNNLACPTGAVALGVVVLKASKKAGGAGGGGCFLVASHRPLAPKERPDLNLGMADWPADQTPHPSRGPPCPTGTRTE